MQGTTIAWLLVAVALFSAIRIVSQFRGMSRKRKKVDWDEQFIQSLRKAGDHGSAAELLSEEAAKRSDPSGSETLSPTPPSAPTILLKARWPLSCLSYRATGSSAERTLHGADRKFKAPFPIPLAPSSLAQRPDKLT